MSTVAWCWEPERPSEKAAQRHKELAMTQPIHNLSDLIRSVPDYPIAGMVYRDMNPLLRNPAAFQQVVDAFVRRYKERAIDAIVGIESRGFILSCTPRKATKSWLAILCSR